MSKKAKKDARDEQKQDEKAQGITKSKMERDAENDPLNDDRKIKINHKNLQSTQKAWQVVNYFESHWKPSFLGKAKKSFTNK